MSSQTFLFFVLKSASYNFKMAHFMLLGYFFCPHNHFLCSLKQGNSLYSPCFSLSDAGMAVVSMPSDFFMYVGPGGQELEFNFKN